MTDGRAAAEKVAKGWGDHLPKFDARTEAWFAGLSKPEAIRHLRRVLATLTMIEKQIEDAQPTTPIDVAREDGSVETLQARTP